MTGTRRSSIIQIAALTGMLLITGGYGQNKPFTFGLRLGPFAPQSYVLQGIELIRYDEGGSPTSISTSGFGLGTEFYLYGQYHQPGKGGVMVELGGRLQKRDLGMSLAPDGLKDDWHHQMTAAAVTISRMHRFLFTEDRATPYLGMGLGAYLIRWETRREYESLPRSWQRGEFILPGLHFLAGFQRPFYQDISLEGQIRYTLIAGNATIRDEDTSEDVKYQGMNFGGVSLQLGLGFSL